MRPAPAAAVTVTRDVPLFPSLVAVIVAAPAATAVTRPAADTVATWSVVRRPGDRAAGQRLAAGVQRRRGELHGATHRHGWPNSGVTTTDATGLPVGAAALISSTDGAGVGRGPPGVDRAVVDRPFGLEVGRRRLARRPLGDLGEPGAGGDPGRAPADAEDPVRHVGGVGEGAEGHGPSGHVVAAGGPGCHDRLAAVGARCVDALPLRDDPLAVRLRRA